jgi:hypothetical protein
MRYVGRLVGAEPEQATRKNGGRHVRHFFLSQKVERFERKQARQHIKHTHFEVY